ncbi:YbjN domain-containing protein [Longispora sp. K20-0274]|uniref:YbjN domain-containing protein n=1 Tax=Longispora sp. K20-0274 TaxID=3088255 RepID=UPI00399B053A
MTALIETTLRARELEFDRVGDRFTVTLPGTHKLKTLCNLIVGEHALRIEAFVIRQPDENREAVWAYLLRRNATMFGVSFAIDAVGDVYLTGRVPLSGLTEDDLDRLLGSVLTYADESFDPLLELGFSSAIRREWAWRVSRGESLANLAAFQHLVDDPDGSNSRQ